MRQEQPGSVTAQGKHSESGRSGGTQSSRSASTVSNGAVQLRGMNFAEQSELLSPRSVQKKGGSDGTRDVHEAAAHGLSGSGGKLPHGDAIQQAFGRHDVSDVQAHVGGKATEGAKAMGAEAFASGNSVAFGAAPSLHTAAHEAAHIVQQRKGVQLSGGVGRSGDDYERHADKVADAVVQGKSAESLLDPFAGGGRGNGVQRKVVQRIAVPADIQAMSIDQCKTEAEAMFVGTGAYANRGILDHKIDAANDMRVDLGRSDPTSITSTIAMAVLQVGIAAGVAALSVGTGPLAAALIAGGGAVIQALPSFFQGGGNELDSTDFCSNYISSTRQGWPGAVATLHGRMNTEASARQVCAETRSLRDNAARVKQAQRNEILDEWMSATARAHAGGNAGTSGMGATSYDDASEGRLHLQNAYLRTNGTMDPPTSATMEGVGLEKLRHYNLDRKIGDIKCPRTMYAMTSLGATALALSPNDTYLIQEAGMSLSRAKSMMASFYVGRELDANDWGFMEGGSDQATIDANWENGLRKAWDQVKGKTLRELGINSIGN